MFKQISLESIPGLIDDMAALVQVSDGTMP